MSLVNIATAYAADPTATIYKQFLGACLTAAGQIRNEALNTGNYANRRIWSSAMLSTDDASVQVRVKQHLRYAAATNATFQANPLTMTDGDVQFIVNSQIDLFAVGS